MAKYALIENNEIIGLYNDLPKNWKNVSNFYALEGETEYLDSLGWKLIQRAVVGEYDPNTQQLMPATFSIVNGNVIENIEIQNILPPTNEELERIRASNHSIAMRQLRERRNELLTATDKTQLNDIIKKNGTTLTAEYETYRQALRDLANTYDNDPNFTDFNTAVFPTEPSAPVVQIIPQTESTPEPIPEPTPEAPSETYSEETGGV